MAFFSDMGKRPDGMTLERKDSNKDYGPENCRWATRKEQQRNTSYNRVLTLNGITMCARAWELALGFPSGLIFGRASRGWSVLDILATPYKPYRKAGRVC